MFPCHASIASYRLVGKPLPEACRFAGPVDHSLCHIPGIRIDQPCCNLGSACPSDLEVPSSRAATPIPTSWDRFTACSLNSAVYSCFDIFFTSHPSSFNVNHRPLEDEKRGAPQFRKLLVRYEKLDRSFLAFNHLAASIIAFRKIKLDVNIICG